MSLAVEAVAVGPDAIERLGQLLATQRGEDPLAPATVVVARSYVGLSLRRLLGGRDGIANVRFVTLPRLAAELGTPHLGDGRHPLTEVVLRAACRAALRDEPGILAPVAEHQATEDALVAAWRALRSATPPALARIAAAGPRQADVVRLAGSVTARLGDRADERDLLDAALQALTLDPGLAAALGPVVIHLPEPFLPGQDALVAGLAAATPVTVLLGATGDPTVDADLPGRAAQLGAPDLAVPDHAAPLGTAAWSAPSADVEVLAVVRDVAARLAAGTPMDRIAVLHGTPQPYALLLRAAFHQAGIPIVAPSTRRLAQALPGRTLLGALALPAGGWERQALIDWIATAPTPAGAVRPDAATVDRLSRRAGIVGGLERWRTGLEAVISEASEATTDPEVALDEVRLRRVERRRDDARSLARFLDHLDRRLTPDPAPTTWRRWAEWCGQLLDALVGGPGDREHWPIAEQEAFAATRQAIHALAGLDGLDPAPDADRFARTLRVQLDAAAPQASRFGTGILVDAYRAAVGLDLDVVYVLGVADGIVPGGVADDALLPDADRVLAEGEVPLLTEQRAGQRRAWLSALAAAPERILTVARADQRTGREQRPARWFLDAVGSLAGSARPLYARDLDDPAVREACTTLPSHLAAVRAPGPGVPAGRHDAELAVLARAVAAGQPAEQHWLNAVHPALARAWELRRDRRLGRYTRFEGHVVVDGLPSPVDASALSPTRLQTYAGCPRRYLLQHVLGIDVPEVPGESIEAEATTVGTIVHEVMERFIEEETAKAPADRIAPEQPWDAAHHDRVQELASQVFDDFSARGLTGHPALWTVRAAAIRRDLATILDGDSARRAAAGAVPERAELSFGVGEVPPATVELPDGRTLRFKGFIDRLDRTRSGGALVVDYKTGSSATYKGLGDDPVKRGQLLQLAIYGLAAQQALGVEEVHAEYWFTSQRGRFERIGYPLDTARLDRFRSVVASLVAGIEAGHFPARPVDGAEGTPRPLCTWCDVAPACPSRSRVRTWEQVRGHALLAPLVGVIDQPWGPDQEEQAS